MRKKRKHSIIWILLLLIVLISILFIKGKFSKAPNNLNNPKITTDVLKDKTPKDNGGTKKQEESTIESEANNNQVNGTNTENLVNGLDNVESKTSTETNKGTKVSQQPSMPTFSLTPETLTKDAVTVTIDYPKEAVKRQYKIEDGIWQDYIGQININDNVTIYAKGTGLDGSESNINSLVISNIDRIPPNVPVIGENLNESTDQLKVVLISYPSDSKLNQYKIDDGTWEIYGGQIYINMNTTIFAKAVDGAGNESNANAYQITFDPISVTTVTPEQPIEKVGTFDYITNAGDKAVWDAISIDKVVPTGTNITTTLATSNDGITYSNFSSSINNVATSKYLKIRISTVSQDESLRATIKGINVLYHFEKQSINSIKPIAVISVNKDLDVKTNTNLIWSADNSYDINQIAIVQEEWQNKQEIYSVPGQYKIQLRVKNELGTWSDWVQKTIDVEVPLNHKPKVDILMNPETDITTETSINWSYAASDIDNDKIIDSMWLNKQSKYVTQGYYQVQLKVKDERGAWSDWVTRTIFVRDKKLDNPKIIVSTNTPTNKNVIVNINYAATTKTNLYSFDGTIWNEYIGPITITENKTIYAKGVKENNEESQIISLTVNNIDKLAPSKPNISYDPMLPTGNAGVNVTIVYSSDSHQRLYSINNGDTWVPYTNTFNVKNNIKVLAKGIDNALNESEIAEINISNIRKVAIPVYTLNPDVETNNDVTLTISYNGVQGKKYKIDNGQWQDYLSPIVIQNNTVVYAKAISDENVESDVVTINIANIDKIGPSDASFMQNTYSLVNDKVVVTIIYPNDSLIKKYKLDNGLWQNYVAGVEVTDNINVYAKSYDSLGNESNISSIKITNIDKTAPAKPIIEVDTTEPLVDAVNIMVTYSSDSYQKKYKIGNGEWQNYVDAIKVTSNQIIYAKGIDIATNESEISQYIVNNINNVLKPIISADKTSMTNQDVIVTINYQNMLYKKYSYDSINWVDYTGQIIVDSNKTIYAKAIDGNSIESTISSLTINNIDKIRPIEPVINQSAELGITGTADISISYAVDSNLKLYSYDNVNWNNYISAINMIPNRIIYAKSVDLAGNESTITSKNIKFVLRPVMSINRADITNQDVILTIDYRGMINKKYSYDNIIWYDYVSPITINSNKIIYAKASDEENTESDVMSLTINNIDKVKPIDPVINQSPTYETTGNVTVSIDYSDDCYQKLYSYDNTNWYSYAGLINLISNKTIYAKGIDLAGNVSNITSKIIGNIVTVLSPSISINPTVKTNQNVTVTIEYKEVVNKKYKIDNGLWQDYTGPFEIAANSTIYAKGADAEGFESVIQSYTITNIDKTPPILASFAQDVYISTNGNVNVTINYPVDAAIKRYKIDNGEWQTYVGPITLNVNSTVYAKTTDDVGNESQVNSITVTNIDKIKPISPTFVQDITDITESSVNVDINYSSDSTYKKYKIANGIWQDYIGPIKLSENATIYAKGIDAAGNESDVSSIDVNNINHKPVAVITMTPNSSIKTSTPIVWSYDNSTDLDNDAIVTCEWENALENYNTAGNKTVRLRVRDSKGAWSNWAETNFNVELDWILINETIYIQDATEEVDWLSSNIQEIIPTNTRIMYYYSTSVDGITFSNETQDISQVADSRYIKVRISYQRIASSSETPSLVSIGINCNRQVFTFVPETMPKKPIATDIGDNANASDMLVSFVKANKEVYLSQYRIIVVPIENVNTFNVYEANQLTSDKYQVVNLGATNDIQLRSDLKDNSGGSIVENKQYKIYILAIGNSELVKNQLSEGSDIIIITPKPANPVIGIDKTAPTNTDITATISYVQTAVVKQYKIGVLDTWHTYTGSITISSNDIIYAKCANSQGIESDITSLNITNIDKTAPNIPTIIANTTNPTNQDIVSTITFDNESVESLYRINSGNWTTSIAKTEQVTMTSNGLIEAKNRDVAGNWSNIAILNIINIDKVAPNPPTISATPTTSTTGNVTVTIAYSTDSVTKQYSYDQINWNLYLDALVLSTNKTVYAKGIDNANNTSTISSITVSNIVVPGSTPPTVTNTPANGNASDISLSFTSPSSEANINEYRIYAVKNGGTFTLDQSLSNSYYLFEAKTGVSKVHNITLTSGSQDSDGNVINEFNTYSFYILSLANTGYTSVLSSPSVSMKLILINSLNFNNQDDVVHQDNTKTEILDGMLTLKGVLGASYSNNLIPTMLTNTTPSGIANSSSSPASACQAFKNGISGVSGKHFALSSPGWIEYEFPTPEVIAKYTVAIISTTDAPIDWTFQASNDGSSWVTLDNVTGQNGSLYWSPFATVLPRWDVTGTRAADQMPRTFTNIQAYKKYRIYVTKSHYFYSYIDMLEMMEPVMGYSTAGHYAVTKTIDTSSWTSIVKTTRTYVTPGGTSLKYLISFDDGATWKNWSGTAWIDVNLADINSTTFSGLPVTEANWSLAGGFVPGTTQKMKIAIGLKTTLDNVTPTLDQIGFQYKK